MSTLRFDYVIVGAGSAGCVLAARLSEDPQVSVCLVEAGGSHERALLDCPGGLALMAHAKGVNWDFHTEPQPGLKGRRGYQPRGKVLGGCSSINAMIYMRGHPSDYDDWAAEGNPGWSWSQVLPYFKRAEDNSRGASVWHGTQGPLSVSDLMHPNRIAADFVRAGQSAGYPVTEDFNGAQQEGFGFFQVTQRQGQRCSTARAYLDNARHRPNLTVLSPAHALQITFDPQAQRQASGVKVLMTGQQVDIRARREVLVCAGALLSPHLLMVSGIGDAAELHAHGVEVIHHLPGVGRHLHDHIDVVQVIKTPFLREVFGLSLRGAARVAHGAWEWMRHRRGVLTTNFAEAGAFVRSGPEVSRPDLQLHFVVAQLIDHGRQTLWGHGYSCHVCVLRPRSRGRVKLLSADPLAAPSLDPAFLTHPDDVELLVRGFSLMRQVMQQPALAQHGGVETARSAHARSPQQIEEFVRRTADTIYHPVGSCRMGSGPLDVVDAQLRVHGVGRLRVVDASVMPHIVGGNTNAPTIMVAEKAADLIRAGLSP